MEKNFKISASLMCADLGHLVQDIKKLEETGVDWLHIDIMDGHFVPNFTFGPDFVKTVSAASSLPLDIHLMVEHPEQYIAAFRTKENDLLCFHVETTNHPQRIIQTIKKMGLKAAIALNPATPLSHIQYILDDLDMIVIMTVNPGFAGQTWLPATLAKIRRLHHLMQAHALNTDLEVDGNIGAHNIPLLKKAGANVFVAGSSSIFMDRAYLANTKKMRDLIAE